MNTRTFTLVKYRDAGLPTYSYFWVDEKHRVMSPYFDTEKEALDWMDKRFGNEDVY